MGYTIDPMSVFPDFQAGVTRAFDGLADMNNKPNSEDRALKKKNKEKVSDPFQQELALQYAIQNPESGILSSPGFEEVNDLYQRKKASQTLPSARPNDPFVYLTKGGFTSSPPTAQILAHRMLDKAEQNGGLNKKDSAVLNRYYGADRSKKQLSGDDYKKARALAEDMVKRRKVKELIKSGQIEPEDGDMAMESMFASNEEISHTMSISIKSMYPNAEIPKNDSDRIRAIRPDGKPVLILRKFVEQAESEGYKIGK